MWRQLYLKGYKKSVPISHQLLRVETQNIVTFSDLAEEFDVYQVTVTMLTCSVRAKGYKKRYNTDEFKVYFLNS